MKKLRYKDVRRLEKASVGDIIRFQGKRWEVNEVNPLKMTLVRRKSHVRAVN